MIGFMLKRNRYLKVFFKIYNEYIIKWMYRKMFSDGIKYYVDRCYVKIILPKCFLILLSVFLCKILINTFVGNTERLKSRFKINSF